MFSVPTITKKLTKIFHSRCCGFMCTNNCKNVVQEQDFEGKTCLHKVANYFYLKFDNSQNSI